MCVYNPNCLEWHRDERTGIEPRRFLCGLVVQHDESFDQFNRLVVALAKSQDHRASCGVFSFGTDRTPSVSKHSVLVAWKKRDTVNDPDGVAFRSDHENEQLDRPSAFGPRYGRSIIEYGVLRVADLFLIGVNKHG